MRRLVLIVIPLVLLGIVSLALVAKKSSTRNANVVNSTLTNISGLGGAVGDQAQSLPQTSARDDVLAVSRIFSERYGSSSSDAPTGNLAAALPFASSALQASFKRVLSLPTQPSEEPTLITSRALAFAIRNIDEKAGTADVVVSLQRQELVGTKNPVIYSQDLFLNLIKEQGSWKVNLGVWGGKQE